MAVRKKNIVPLRAKTSDPGRKRPKSVTELKKKYQDLPLHFLFGISKAIDYQCPTLDDYLDEIKTATTALGAIRKAKSLEEAQVEAAKALHALTCLTTGIDEETRANFEKLRNTAEEWKQLAIEAINLTEDPEKLVKI
jgi:hypothetical protein